MPRKEQLHLQGQLQRQVMRVVWRLGRCRVEEVRRELPRRQRGAYTTIQTVLNRLAGRGLIKRERSARVILYTPSLSEAEYLSRSLNHTLSGASDQARRAALADLVGDLDQKELDEIRGLAREVGMRRRGRGS